MNETDRAIFYYKKAYFEFNKRSPDIIKSGSWIRIGGFNQAFRAREVRAMTSRLVELKHKRDIESVNSRKDVWYVDIPSPKPVKVREVGKQNSWKDYVGEDIINMFLNKLFSICDNSAYTMEKCLKDFALSGKIPRELGESEDMEYYKNALKNTIKRHKRNIEEKDNSWKRIVQVKNKAIQELEIKIETLRKNSVLFTMEDLEEVNYSKRKKKKR